MLRAGANNGISMRREPQIIQILKIGIWHSYRVKDLQMEEEMKLLSIAIPSYNSQEYMEH